MSNIDLSGFVNGTPSITRVAMSMKFIFRTFETKGKLREARRLHSITFMSLSRARNWMLKGPEMLSEREISLLMRLIFLIVSTYVFCRGKTLVASPA